MRLLDSVCDVDGASGDDDDDGPGLTMSEGVEGSAGQFTVANGCAGGDDEGSAWRFTTGNGGADVVGGGGGDEASAWRFTTGNDGADVVGGGGGDEA